MDFNNSITGFKELDKTFSNLPRTTQRRAIVPALRAGAFVVRDMAAANVKAVTSGDSTGLLERSLRVYNYKKYRGNYRVAVQVKRGLVNTKKIVNGQPVRVGLYAAVLEYGKEGQAPRSWIRKAIRDGQGAAVSALTKEASKRMVDAVRDARR